MAQQLRTAGADGGSYSFRAIGTIHSPFKEKFGIPRQPGLLPAATARLELLPPYDREEALHGLEGFSHLWLLFVFHGIKREAWRPTVRPPRLGGNERIGVFASRSTHRPNPIGMSVVEFAGISREGGRLYLELRNIDLLDGTPVLDIKPYLAYADALPHAACGYAAQAPGHVPVHFSTTAEQACVAAAADYPQLALLVEQVLRLDPRPPYQTEAGRRYGCRLFDFNVVWHFDGQAMVVDEILPVYATHIGSQGE